MAYRSMTGLSPRVAPGPSGIIPAVAVWHLPSRGTAALAVAAALAAPVLTAPSVAASGTQLSHDEARGSAR